MPRNFATEPAPDEPNAEEAEGHMPLKRGVTDPPLDEPGMPPAHVIKRGAADPAPDEPEAQDTEGHRGRS